jgi:hypothetical protein
VSATLPRAALAVAAGLTGIGLFRIVDALASSLRGDGTVDGVIPLVALLVAMVTVILMRRYGKHERRTAITMRRYVRWSLACAMPLFLFSGGKAPFTDTAEAGRQTAMKNDLRNLVGAQEKASADSGRFTANPAITVSPGIRRPEITLTRDGWSASVSAFVTTRVCTVYIGETPLPPARNEAQPMCTKAPLRTGQLLEGALVILVGLLAGIAIVRLAPRRPPRALEPMPVHAMDED